MTDKEQIRRYWEFANQKQAALYNSLIDTFSALSDDIQAIFDRFMRIELTGNLSKRETETLHRKIKQWRDAGYSDSYQLKLYMRDLENRSRIKGHEALFLYLFAAFTGRYRGLMNVQLPILQAISQNTFEREGGDGRVTEKELNSLLSNLPDGTSYEDQMFGYAQYGAKRTADAVRNAKQRDAPLEVGSPDTKKILDTEQNRLLKPSQASEGQPQNYHGYLDFAMTAIVGYSAMRALQSTGNGSYIFLAVMDGRTTEACKHLNQKQFKLSEMKLGVNVPPITVDYLGRYIPHPCRSIIRPVSDLKTEREGGTIAFEENSNIFDGERDIVNKKVEHGIAFDSYGKILFKKTGDAGRIALTDYEKGMLKGAIFSHNHPGNGPLSPSDLFNLWNFHMKEVRAVTKHGIFSVQQPEQWKVIPISRQAMNQEYQSMIPKFYGPISRRIAKGAFDPEQADYLLQRLIIRRMSKRYGFTMNLIKWGE
ncbi:MAG: hypothetical protein DBY45_10310 [Clostridiales bacterium]|nr:MAG: hypothetical protein DBY45_10310 [Clostridiales bacterium]